MKSSRSLSRAAATALLALLLFAAPPRAHASLFRGETLDSIANDISWVVLIISRAATIPAGTSLTDNNNN